MIKKQTIAFFAVLVMLATLFITAEMVSQHLGYSNFFERFNELVLKK